MPSLNAEPVVPPTIKSPAAVIGDRALNPASAVVWPVPPFAIATVPVTLPTDTEAAVTFFQYPAVPSYWSKFLSAGEVNSTFESVPPS